MVGLWLGLGWGLGLGSDEKGKVKVTAMSPRAHADPTPPGHCRMQDGQTALMYAAVYGHKGVAALLLQNGADTDAKDEVWGMMRVCV